MLQRNPPHPGSFIQRNYIEPLELVAGDVADALGVNRGTFSRLLNEKADLSPEMALRLSKVLGRSAESWLQLQVNHSLAKAMKGVAWKSARQLTAITQYKRTATKKIAAKKMTEGRG